MDHLYPMMNAEGKQNHGSVSAGWAQLLSMTNGTHGDEVVSSFTAMDSIPLPVTKSYKTRKSFFFAAIVLGGMHYCSCNRADKERQRRLKIS
ncbi:hypothetical protein Leryth_019455 [Lithospermum erythrorhizon]|nr:hypothetical protein Leryth_019455 [Lithospermum erythrorhizon]